MLLNNDWAHCLQALAEAAAGLPDGAAHCASQAELGAILIQCALALLAAASDGPAIARRLVRKLHILIGSALPCLPLLRFLLAVVDLPVVCLVRPHLPKISAVFLAC